MSKPLKSIADAQKNGLILPIRGIKGGLSPWPPVDRVTGVLEEIGRFFVLKFIHGIRQFPFLIVRK